jgi:serine/threonine-protein kinase Chk2
MYLLTLLHLLVAACRLSGALVFAMIRRLIHTLQASPDDAPQESFKKPRRSERLSSQRVDDGYKTPISTRQQLPSPVTHDTSDDADLRTIKEATATPPEGRPSQVTHRDDNYSQAYAAFSSPPQDTQAFSQHVDLNAPLSDEVEDEVKEGVWGYLFPMDSRHGGRCVVLKKRTSCNGADTVAQALPLAARKGGRRGPKALIQQEESFEQQKANGMPSGGYLIGRHPECGRYSPAPRHSAQHSNGD